MIVALDLKIGCLSHLVVDLNASALTRQVCHEYYVDKEYFYPTRCNFTPLLFYFYFVFVHTCSKQLVKKLIIFKVTWLQIMYYCFGCHLHRVIIMVWANPSWEWCICWSHMHCCQIWLKCLLDCDEELALMSLRYWVNIFTRIFKSINMQLSYVYCCHAHIANWT